ncbi:hypothetical protein BJF79_18245 [Actinomadura sp. CNU-125]|uniref:sensor histidine kinase n=1 Tax=Actinomadura sp. CNU-125 TaxID=1904961 RepID=UPI00095FA52E|nr:ATP-binding protein [Actinomadura sp. CNU-125]OLT16562.1 hypothetical protein BJF79_18245 [Actinomadura sp. CNU-125]
MCALCLAHGELVPGQVLQASAGTGWVDIAAGSGVFIAQFALRQPAGMAVALLIAAAYTAGAPGPREAPVLLLVQGALAATLVGLLRREARAVDRELAARADAAAARARVRRPAPTSATSSAACTTPCSRPSPSSAPAGSTPRPPCWPGARRPTWAVIGRPAGRAGARRRRTAGRAAPVDLALRAAATAPRPGLPALRVARRPRTVRAAARRPWRRSRASAEEALANVARHAGTGTARLALERTPRAVVLTIADDGDGFDPTAVPPHRRGLRESVHGRMRAAGGGACVESRPGTGTCVRLWWPDA